MQPRPEHQAHAIPRQRHQVRRPDEAARAPSPRRAAKEEVDPKVSIRADSKIVEKVLKARRLERTGRRTSNLRHKEEDKLPPLSTMQRGRQLGEA